MDTGLQFTPPLVVYRASAGSGKTFTLVKEMLDFIIQQPEAFDRILAVTFTNKAAAEIKKRLISTLFELANGEGAHIRKLLAESTALPDAAITQRANRALRALLHRYGLLGVSTIDSLFQRILRGFSRELDLPLPFEPELDGKRVLQECVGRLFAAVGTEPELTNDLTDFLLYTFEEQGSWKIRNKIETFGNVLLDERISVQPQDGERQALNTLKDELIALTRSFTDSMREIALQAHATLDQYQLTVDDLSYNRKGAFGYFYKLQSKRFEEPKGRVINILSGKENWFAKASKIPHGTQASVSAALTTLLGQAATLYNTQYTQYYAAKAILNQLHTYNLLSRLKREMDAWPRRKKRVLLIDSLRHIRTIAEGASADFLYEKIGARYESYLIDEFQDTSALQFGNFVPLLLDAMASGKKCFLLGDVKQSIYRWRGADSSLMLQLTESANPTKPTAASIQPTAFPPKTATVAAQFHADMRQVRALDANFRSSPDVVNFNNAFFSTLTTVAAGSLNHELDAESFTLLADVYADVAQRPARKHAGGGRITFVGGENKEEQYSAVEAQLPTLIAEVFAQGYTPADVVFLVRKNDEGRRIAEVLYDKIPWGDGYARIVSDESLQLRASPRVRFLADVIEWLHRPFNSILEAQMLLRYQNLTQAPDAHNEPSITVAATSEARREAFNRTFKVLKERQNLLRKLPVYELVEELLLILELYHKPDAYLQRFQDLIYNFGKQNENPDPLTFLDWWADKGLTTSITAPEVLPDAIRILTVHKSKGLEFPIVIMPYCEWELFDGAFKAPLLWLGLPEELTSVTTPDPALPPLFPVRASNKNELQRVGAWKPYIQAESTRQLVDNLNLLYVAFTRAADKLFAFPVAGKTINSLSALIYNTLSNMPAEQCRWDADQSAFIFGQVDAPKDTNSHKPKESPNNYPLTYWQPQDWRHKMAIRPRTAGMQLNPQTITALSRGIRAHELLATIRSEADISRVADADLQAFIRQIAAAQPLWFAANAQIYTEGDIVTEGGKMHRPDRVVLHPDGSADVVDYKTGAQAADHANQLRRYGKVLAEMGRQPVRLWLCYLADDKNPIRLVTP